MAWINQCISEVKELIENWRAGRKISMVATADHVELTDTHLVMGLNLDWCNQTEDPIPVKEIQVMVYMHGKGEAPLRFYPLERFARVPTQKVLKKTPVRPFTLSPQEIHTEHLRFISQEVLNIAPGNYTVDVHLIDTSETSYTNRTKIHLESRIKYRRSEEWHAN